MTPAEIARLRLRSQRLGGNPLKTPTEAVAWLGAVQAQDFGAAKWAVAQRLRNATALDLDATFNDGRILRTHVMRPTWHFLAPADIRWLLKLTAPRVRRLLAYYDRQLGVDAARRRKSRTVIERALNDAALTRAEIGAAHRRARIDAGGQTLGHLLMHAELDGLICSGPLKGKQFTYALLEQRVPPADELGDDAALAELARRYFTSHGPATVPDFVWWSGLTTAQARRALDMAQRDLEPVGVEEKTYWLGPVAAGSRPKGPVAHLLPNFDELTVAYKDRGATVGADVMAVARTGGFLALSNVVVIDGQAVGPWKRVVKKNAVTITATSVRRLARAERDAVEAAADAYGSYLGLAAELRLEQP